METKLIKTASGMEVDVKEFVKKWMDSHEPDTFVRNAFGVPIYTAGCSSINLESFFEILLSDFISDNPNQQPTLLTEDKEGEGQGDAVEFAEWIQKEVEKENIMRSVIVGKYLIFENDDVIIRKTTQELYEQFKITRL